MANMHRLGKNQLAWLECVVEKGYWCAHCGFNWGIIGASERLCQSLEKRGLLKLTQVEQGIMGRDRWVPTEEGKQAIKSLRLLRKQTREGGEAP